MIVMHRKKRYAHFAFALVSMLFLSNRLGAAKNPKISDGDTVSIAYTLKVNNKIIETTGTKNPYIYVHGSEQLLPSLEKKLKGLKIGNKKKVKLLPKDAYGEINQRAVEIVPLNTFKEPKALKIGQIISGQRNGRTVKATIKAIDNQSVILDLNHPLAGQTLHYEIEVVNIKPTKP